MDATQQQRQTDVAIKRTGDALRAISIVLWVSFLLSLTGLIVIPVTLGVFQRKCGADALCAATRRSQMALGLGIVATTMAIVVLLFLAVVVHVAAKTVPAALLSLSRAVQAVPALLHSAAAKQAAMAAASR